MRIDLHAHSNRSDGTATPAELVGRARAVGLDVVAITDHDTHEGWEEAASAAEQSGVALVRGMEISCTYAGRGVHLLAYLLDPGYPALAEELARVLRGRDERLPKILRRLRDVGVEITAEDVARVSGDASASGRPHVADALVSLGVVGDRAEAFDRYLGAQGPAYVHRYAAPLEEMLAMVSDAGGVSVLAHPWARHDHEALDEAGLSRLGGAGLAGVEVDHQDHSPAQRADLRALARGLDLVVTGSSDYHGLGKVDHELGCNTTDPAEYERLLERAGSASRRSGRATPHVVNG